MLHNKVVTHCLVAEQPVWRRVGASRNYEEERLLACAKAAGNLGRLYKCAASCAWFTGSSLRMTCSAPACRRGYPTRRKSWGIMPFVVAELPR